MAETRITKRIHRVDSIEGIHLLNNYVLCEEVLDNLSTPTKSGIYKASAYLQRDQYLANYANRLHRVVKVCDQLTFWTPKNKVSGNSMRWVTSIEIEVDDLVWTSYMASIDYDCVLLEDRLLKLVHYEELRLAQNPKVSYRLLNGFIGYVHPQISRSSILYDPKPKIDFSRGIVTMLGEKNTGYVVSDKRWEDSEKDIDLEIGDIFLKNTPENRLILEDPLFRYFSQDDLFLIQRKNIIAIDKG